MGGNVRRAFKGPDKPRSCSGGSPSDTPSGQSVESQSGRSGSYSSVDSGSDVSDSDARGRSRGSASDHERLYCPFCGSEGPVSGDNYCSKCGEELTGVF